MSGQVNKAGGYCHAPLPMTVSQVTAAGSVAPQGYRCEDMKKGSVVV